MNEKFLKEKKSQKILLSVMAALILILAVCAISTADTAIPENALTQCDLSVYRIWIMVYNRFILT